MMSVKAAPRLRLERSSDGSEELEELESLQPVTVRV